MSDRNKKRGLISRYRTLGRDLHSRKFSVRNRAQRLLAVTVCVPVMLACVLYGVHWIRVKNRIETENKGYSALYITESPTQYASSEPSPAVTAKASPSPTPIPTQAPTATPLPDETAAPDPTEQIIDRIPIETQPEPELQTAQPAAPIVTNTPESEFNIADDELLLLSTTPDSETIVHALQTPPPVQTSFDSLLETNPETVGFITIGSQISLPVVQRPNDNDFYLTHNFAGEESEGGTLFLDGSNLLVPADNVLLVYGHNMRNGTMFQPLTNYERPDFLRINPVIRFNTIYQDALYTPVAVFRASMNQDTDNFLSIRQFSFDETQWELYNLKLEKLSMYDMEVKVPYGDQLLLLVTCEYTHDNGRLIVAARKLRPGETEESCREALSTVALKPGK